MANPSIRGSSLPPFTDVGGDRVRHLCDGRQAYPAMLDALAAAKREVLLEMYWVGADAAGERFRDALVQCVRRGVAVRVVYDDVGSLGLSPSWWAPVVAEGGTVVAYGPIAPWRKRFRWVQVFFRDHRKLLLVDRVVGFAGGINLARPWLPGDEGGLDWRDDAVEVHGPIAGDLRRLFSAARCALFGSSPFGGRFLVLRGLPLGSCRLLGALSTSLGLDGLLLCVLTHRRRSFLARCLPGDVLLLLRRLALLGLKFSLSLSCLGVGDRLLGVGVPSRLRLGLLQLAFSDQRFISTDSAGDFLDLALEAGHDSAPSLTRPVFTHELLLHSRHQWPPDSPGGGEGVAMTVFYA